MFNKLLLVSALILSVRMVNAQNQPALPAILPPAPNASELGRFGNLPVNLSSGAAGLNIALSSIDAGNAKTDISLSYNSNGIKVDQIASRAGLGWVLNAGGVINRVVHDNPDERSTWLNPPNDLGSNSMGSNAFLNAASQTLDQSDTQPDIFSYNFNGYSGKFILNQQNKSQVVFLSKCNLKIETDFSLSPVPAWTFKITDGAGVKYYFGGETATEKSKTSSSGQGCGKTYGTYIPNAWYLLKIEAPSGENLMLDYTPCSFTYTTSFSQNITATPTETKFTVLTTIDGVNYYPDDIYDNNVCASNLDNIGVILKKIRSSRGDEVRFSYRGRLDVPVDSLISEINFYSRTPVSSVKKFVFSYSEVQSSTGFASANNYVTNTYRPYLNSLNERSSDNSLNREHHFEYDHPELLPQRLAFAQDSYGFFNGRNNINFIPRPEIQALEAIFPHATADRGSYADYVSTGMLTKVTYPTGGSDSIAYESHSTTYAGMVQGPKPKYNLAVSIVGTGNRTEASSISNFSIDEFQIIKIFLSSEYSGTGVNDLIHQLSRLIIRDAVTQTIVYQKSLNIGEVSNENISLNVGSYEVTISSYGQAALGSTNIEYSNGPIPPPVYEERTEIVGGARVKNITRFDPVTGNTNIKSYRYTQPDKPNIVSGVLMRPAVTYFSEMAKRKQVNYSGGTLNFPVQYKVASSNGDLPLFDQNGNHILYSNVIEMDCDNFNNGGSWHQFTLFKDAPPELVLGKMFPQVSFSSSGLPATRESYNLQFKIAQIGFIKVKEQSMTYKISPVTEEIFGYAVKKNYDNDGLGGDNPYDVARYLIFSSWIYNDSVTTKSYDGNGLNPVTTTQVNYFDNMSHFQMTRQVTNKSDGAIMTTLYKYPHEMVAAGAVQYYQDMINANQIEQVIEKENWLNDSLQTKDVTTFSNALSDNPSLFLPAIIKTKIKNFPEEERITFLKYDHAGNVLGLRKRHGPSVSYQWGYKGSYPVAEVKNASSIEFFYQGFEDQANADSISEAHTGRKSTSHALVTWAAPAGRNYVISYFYKTAMGWKYSGELPYNNASFTMTGGVLYDDIRIHPVDAQMTTYTYKPLVGLTTSTDVKGQTTTYEYDSFNRLKYIKDQHGKVIKQFDYHHQNQ